MMYENTFPVIQSVSSTHIFSSCSDVPGGSRFLITASSTSSGTFGFLAIVAASSLPSGPLHTCLIFSESDSVFMRQWIGRPLFLASATHVPTIVFHDFLSRPLNP